MRGDLRTGKWMDVPGKWMDVHWVDDESRGLARSRSVEVDRAGPARYRYRSYRYRSYRYCS